MPIERKSYPVADIKVSEEAGVIEAIVSVFNNVDAGDEIVRPGFFEKSIAKKLPKGVWAHDWKQPIAKTLEAKELHPGDPALPAELQLLGGTYIKGQFNLETQRGREAYSDIKFGIVDEFSIGYRVIKDGEDKETGARELIEGDWKEWSPVLVGMNDQTRLISIKEESAEAVTDPPPVDPPQEKKGMLAEEMAATIPSVYDVQRSACGLVRKFAESAKNSAITGAEFDWESKIDLLAVEFGSTWGAAVKDQIREFLESSDDEFYLKGISGTESFESFEAAGTELKKFAQKMRSNHEIRTKEGRVLSSSNRAKVQTCLDSMTAVMTDLTDLMAMSEPKPKETEKENAIDVATLRTQSLRLESKILLSRLQTLKE